mgnify:CR=1 FL=1
MSENCDGKATTPVWNLNYFPFDRACPRSWQRAGKKIPLPWFRFDSRPIPSRLFPPEQASYSDWIVVRRGQWFIDCRSNRPAAFLTHHVPCVFERRVQRSKPTRQSLVSIPTLADMGFFSAPALDLFFSSDLPINFLRFLPCPIEASIRLGEILGSENRQLRRSIGWTDEFECLRMRCFSPLFLRNAKLSIENFERLKIIKYHSEFNKLYFNTWFVLTNTLTLWFVSVIMLHDLTYHKIERR